MQSLFQWIGKTFLVWGMIVCTCPMNGVSFGECAGDTKRGMQSQQKSGYMVISGLIHDDGTLSIQPILTTPDLTLDLPGSEGQYTLLCLNHKGQTLNRYRFEPQDMKLIQKNGSDRYLDSGSFVFQIPYDPLYKRLVVLCNQTVIWEKSRSAHPPQVFFKTPRNNTHICEKTEVAWSAQDKDQNPLHFQLRFSPDAGTSWQPLTGLIPASSITLDPKYLPPSQEGKLQILCSDGFNTAKAELRISTTRPFTVEYTVPADGQQDVTTTPTVMIQFSNQVKSKQQLRNHLSIAPQNGQQVPGEMSIMGDQAFFRPIDPLQSETVYRAMIRKGLEDVFGSLIQNDFSWQFSTWSQP